MRLGILHRRMHSRSEWLPLACVTSFTSKLMTKMWNCCSPVSLWKKSLKCSWRAETSFSGLIQQFLPSTVCRDENSAASTRDPIKMCSISGQDKLKLLWGFSTCIIISWVIPAIGKESWKSQLGSRTQTGPSIRGKIKFGGNLFWEHNWKTAEW